MEIILILKDIIERLMWKHAIWFISHIFKLSSAQLTSLEYQDEL